MPPKRIRRCGYRRLLMELLSIGFIKLIIKVTICVSPAILGIYLLALSDERKREIRNSLCNRVFGVSNAIPMPSFERSLLVIAILAILFSAAASWFLLLSRMF